MAFRTHPANFEVAYSHPSRRGQTIGGNPVSLDMVSELFGFIFEVVRKGHQDPHLCCLWSFDPHIVLRTAVSMLVLCTCVLSERRLVSTSLGCLRHPFRHFVTQHAISGTY